MTKGAREFIERLGLLAEEQGIPRIGGRMIGYLLLHDEQKSLDQIAEDLQVSKASISLNGRWLEKLGVVERVGSPGDRRDYYRIADQPWEQIYAVAQQRLQRTHDLLELGLRLLGEEEVVGRRRIKEWQWFYAFMLDDFRTKLERWREFRARREAGEAASPEDLAEATGT